MFGGKFLRSFPSQNQSIMAGEVSGENGHEIWYYIHYPKTFFFLDQSDLICLDFHPPNGHSLSQITCLLKIERVKIIFKKIK